MATCLSCRRVGEDRSGSRLDFEGGGEALTLTMKLEAKQGQPVLDGRA